MSDDGITSRQSVRMKRESTPGKQKDEDSGPNSVVARRLVLSDRGSDFMASQLAAEWTYSYKIPDA